MLGTVPEHTPQMENKTKSVQVETEYPDEVLGIIHETEVSLRVVGAYCNHSQAVSEVSFRAMRFRLTHRCQHPMTARLPRGILGPAQPDLHMDVPEADPLRHCVFIHRR